VRTYNDDDDVYLIRYDDDFKLVWIDNDSGIDDDDDDVLPSKIYDNDDV
jgi:hypothetical protein